mmetsp:Transcript_44845/g.106357  ORF Transcript_44845/g.106357 Transcript_44845/m.106357 type:complete len:240 (-) Transcript_44845:442-1161(-)
MKGRMGGRMKGRKGGGLLLLLPPLRLVLARLLSLLQPLVSRFLVDERGRSGEVGGEEGVGVVQELEVTCRDVVPSQLHQLGGCAVALHQTLGVFDGDEEVVERVRKERRTRALWCCGAGVDVEEVVACAPLDVVAEGVDRSVDYHLIRNQGDLRDIELSEVINHLSERRVGRVQYQPAYSVPEGAAPCYRDRHHRPDAPPPEADAGGQRVVLEMLKHSFEVLCFVEPQRDRLALTLSAA